MFDFGFIKVITLLISDHWLVSQVYFTSLPVTFNVLNIALHFHFLAFEIATRVVSPALGVLSIITSFYETSFLE
jgi:hypothetical protein